MINSIFLSKQHLTNNLFLKIFFFNAKKYTPALLLLEPIIESDVTQFLFLAKKVSSYLSDYGNHNSLITYEQLSLIKNVIDKVPIIIVIPISGDKIFKYDKRIREITNSNKILIPKFKNIEIKNNYSMFTEDFNFVPLEWN